MPVKQRKEIALPLIKPFKGVVYNQDKIEKLSAVVAPPYDIIPQSMQEALYRASPYNIVRLILGKIEANDNADNNRYSRAKETLESWLKDRIMVKDDRDALYIYSQSYRKNNKAVEQIGFIGLMGLDMVGKESVLPHENTLLAPKTDRLNLMRSVKANLSPIFVLYDDAKKNVANLLNKFVASREASIDVEFDNVRHRVWKLDDARVIEKIEALMADKDIFIADGHHRYEVARTYAAELARQDAPGALKEAARYMMVYFVAADEDMLTILPAHRLVKDAGPLTPGEITERLTKYFELEKVKDLETLESKLSRLTGRHAFGLYLGKKEFYLLKLNDAEESDRAMKAGSKDWKRLDVAILHLFVFQHVLGIRDEDDNIEFLKSPEEAARQIDEGKYKIAFFLNPTKVAQVKRIAKLGEKMPRKATYFYPKPLSGLVINKD